MRRHHHVVRLVEQVRKIAVVIQAVEKKVVVQRACAAGAEAGGVARTRLADRDANSQLRQLDRVATVQRQPDNRLGWNHLTGLRRVGLQQRRLVLHLDRLTDLTNLQRGIEALTLLYIERDRPNEVDLEAGRRDRDTVRANPHRADGPGPGFIAGSGIGEVGAGQ